MRLDVRSEAESELLHRGEHLATVPSDFGPVEYDRRNREGGDALTDMLGQEVFSGRQRIGRNGRNRHCGCVSIDNSAVLTQNFEVNHLCYFSDLRVTVN